MSTAFGRTEGLRGFVRQVPGPHEIVLRERQRGREARREDRGSVDLCQTQKAAPQRSKKLPLLPPLCGPDRRQGWPHAGHVLGARVLVFTLICREVFHRRVQAWFQLLWFAFKSPLSLSLSQTCSSLASAHEEE